MLLTQQIPSEFKYILQPASTSNECIKLLLSLEALKAPVTVDEKHKQPNIFEINRSRKALFSSYTTSRIALMLCNVYIIVKRITKK